MLERSPKVSVCVVTYNHENYLRDCLQSLVEQKTDFDFEILVADDCSTDATRKVITEFSEKYASLIKPIFHPKNLGPFENYLAVHEQAQGEYIAHMDGDDYALPGKLQAQSDYLDRHQECTIVWHRMKILDDTNNRLVDDLIELERLPATGFTQRDLLILGSVACHSSKMYRAEHKFINASSSEFLDFFIDAHQLANGVGNYVDGVYGVYRANVGIASSSLKTRIILLNNLVMLASRFPDNRRAVSAHILKLMLGDVYHRRSTLSQSFQSLVKVFHPLSFIDILSTSKCAKMFRSPL